MRGEMHDCQKFREDWASDGSMSSRSGCEGCDRFCEEAIAALQCLRMTDVPFDESPEYWERFDNQLRTRLTDIGSTPSRSLRWTWPLTAAAALILIGVWIGLRDSGPEVVTPKQPEGRIQFVDDHIRGLDPVVVNFLGQSELFLRSFTKIGPSDRDDIEDARTHARQDLEEIAEQKVAAGDFSPVRIALEDYEGVLREIKNFDSTSDLIDIQNRIQRNGLIASMKAYQPRAVLVSQR